MRLLATILKNRHNKYNFMTKSVKVVKEVVLKNQISCSAFLY